MTNLFPKHIAHILLTIAFVPILLSCGGISAVNTTWSLVDLLTVGNPIENSSTEIVEVKNCCTSNTFYIGIKNPDASYGIAVMIEVVAVIELGLTTATLVAAAPPKLTVAPDEKPVPVIVTDVPPLVLPEVGEIAVTVGAGELLVPASKLSKMTLPGA